MFNKTLQSRSSNYGITQTFSTPKTTAYPHNSPFNILINDDWGSTRYTKPTHQAGEYDYAFQKGDGIFPNGIGKPVAGTDELWSVSGMSSNSYHAMYSDANEIKEEWVTATAIDDGMKTQALSDAMLFLPTVFSKLETYESNLSNGISVNPDSIFTPAELQYIKTLPEDKEFLKKMVEEVNKKRVETGREPIAMPPSLAPTPPGPPQGPIPPPGGLPAPIPGAPPIGPGSGQTQTTRTVRAIQGMLVRANDDPAKEVILKREIPDSWAGNPQRLADLEEVASDLADDEKDQGRKENFDLIQDRAGNVAMLVAPAALVSRPPGSSLAVQKKKLPITRAP